MRKIVDRITEVLTCTIMLVMVAMATWQIFSRFVLNSPSSFSEEFLRYSLVWLTMIGGAYAFGKREHLAITYVVEKLPDKLQKGIGTLLEVLILVFILVVFIFGGILTMQNASGQVSSALGMPIPFLYLSLIVSGCLIIFYSYFHIRESLAYKGKGFESEVLSDLAEPLKE